MFVKWTLYIVPLRTNNSRKIIVKDDSYVYCAILLQSAITDRIGVVIFSPHGRKIRVQVPPADVGILLRALPGVFLFSPLLFKYNFFLPSYPIAASALTCTAGDVRGFWALLNYIVMEINTQDVATRRCVSETLGGV